MKKIFKFLTLVMVHLCLNIYSINGLRILGLFPLHIRSHFTMCEELMRGLAAKGHQVDVYSHFPLKESVPNYRDYSLQGTLPPIYNNLTFEVAQIADLDTMMKHWFETHQGSVCRLMDLPLFQKLLYNPPKDPPYDIVIVELSIVYCYIPFGKHLGIPVVGVVTLPLLDWQFESFGSPINLASDPSSFSPYAAPMSFLERLDNILTHKQLVHSFSKYSKPQDKYVEKYFGYGYKNIVDLQKDCSLVLVNHDMSLNGLRPFAPKVIPIGGLHVVDRNETLPQIVQKWLDESDHGCVYFSFGSMTRIETFPKQITDAFYTAFKAIAPVRVLLKIAKSEEMAPGLPPNVLVQPWLQQIQVLKHKNIKAFITHGGLMGTQESVYFGVPMIGVPLFADQHFNVESYARQKIAIKVTVQEITKESFTNAMTEILTNPIYRESIQKASRKFRDHPISLLNTAIYWIEYIDRYGKDALKSPIEDMPWWQATLLDIYTLFISLIVLSIYIIFKIMKTLICFIFAMLHYENSVKIKLN